MNQPPSLWKTAIQQAFSLLKIQLYAQRYHIRPDSQPYHEMRAALPYAIVEDQHTGWRIMLNKHLQPIPQAADVTKTTARGPSSHALPAAAVPAITSTASITYLYDEATAPWVSRLCGETYLKRLRQLTITMQR